MFAAILAGTLFLALAARIEIPMVPVPFTLQSYAVVVLGALLGWRRGLATVVLYLALAAAGLPVLAGGGSGVARLTGPTAGYIAGFALAIVLVGRLAESRWTARGRVRPLLAMLCGHALILASGWVWLATRVGAAEAALAGVTPFLPGAAVKSVLAAGTVALARRVRAPAPDSPELEPPPVDEVVLLPPRR